MARQLHKLDAVTARALAKPGRHSDGGGLYLKVRPDGRRGWVFLFRWLGRTREIGLGSFLPVHAEKGRRYDFVTLADARTKAASMRVTLAEGRDPAEAASKSAAVPTFGEFADAHIEAMKPAWRNEKHVAQWQMTLGDAYCRSLRRKPVNEVDTAVVLAVLQPIWKTKTETAAMNYSDLPGFVERLRVAEGMSARSLEFLILTAARTGEVLGARWDEFDLSSSIWTIPAARMKAGREHRVPLSDRAVAIVTALSENQVSDFVFPGLRRDRPLSGIAPASRSIAARSQSERFECGLLDAHTAPEGAIKVPLEVVGRNPAPNNSCGQA